MQLSQDKRVKGGVASKLKPFLQSAAQVFGSWDRILGGCVPHTIEHGAD
jgi:hypothetical protein